MKKIKFKPIRKSFINVFGGNILTKSVFINNMSFIVITIIIVFVYISHRYTVSQRMSEIEKLQYELKDVKYEALTISSQLTEASRQTEIEQLVEQNGLQLKISEEPVYRIKKD